VRRRWYQNKGLAGEKITPRARVNFLLGDLSERTMVYFVTHGCVGPGKLYSEVYFGEPDGTIEYQGKSLTKYKQITTSFTIETENGPLTITGHFDGLGKRNSDGLWELIEFKSSSNNGFRMFSTSGDVGDYLKQAHALMLTDLCKEKDVKGVRFFYLRKETGHMWDAYFNWDTDTEAQVIAEFKAAIAQEEPARPYILKRKLTGEFVFQDWHCGYCPYTAECYKEYKIDTVFKSGKPSYILTEKK
jgi:hypothetical protein